MQSRNFSSPAGRYLAGLVLVMAVIALTASGYKAQSLSYSSGQNVSPAFEGWETDADGNSFFLFGYMNNNWDEELDVPVGPDNSFNLIGADVGQPTHFLPRRNRFVFKVPVPKMARPFPALRLARINSSASWFASSSSYASRWRATVAGSRSLS